MLFEWLYGLVSVQPDSKDKKKSDVGIDKWGQNFAEDPKNIKSGRRDDCYWHQRTFFFHFMKKSTKEEKLLCSFCFWILSHYSIARFFCSCDFFTEYLSMIKMLFWVFPMLLLSFFSNFSPLLFCHCQKGCF